MRLRTVSTVFACACFALVCALCRTANVSRLRAFDGARAFYLHSASSQSLMKTTLGLSDIDDIRGESVTIERTFSDGERTAFVAEILEKYDAEIIIEEACGEVVSYYCYTPNFRERVYVNGKAVNLHIAIAANRAALGVPLVFGGF